MKLILPIGIGKRNYTDQELKHLRNYGDKEVDDMLTGALLFLGLLGVSAVRQAGISISEYNNVNVVDDECVEKRALLINMEIVILNI